MLKIFGCTGFQYDTRTCLSKSVGQDQRELYFKDDVMGDLPHYRLLHPSRQKCVKLYSKNLHVTGPVLDKGFQPSKHLLGG